MAAAHLRCLLRRRWQVFGYQGDIPAAHSPQGLELGRSDSLVFQQELGARMQISDPRRQEGLGPS